MHPGNHVWTHRHTGLAQKHEREAEDFAHTLPLDVHEVVDWGFTHSCQIAEYFGVPEEVLGLQVPRSCTDVSARPSAHGRAVGAIQR